MHLGTCRSLSIPTNSADEAISENRRPSIKTFELSTNTCRIGSAMPGSMLKCSATPQPIGRQSGPRTIRGVEHTEESGGENSRAATRHLARLPNEVLKVRDVVVPANERRLEGPRLPPTRAERDHERGNYGANRVDCRSDSPCRRDPFLQSMMSWGRRSGPAGDRIRVHTRSQRPRRSG